jgi:hypothetical protein
VCASGKSAENAAFRSSVGVNDVLRALFFSAWKSSPAFLKSSTAVSKCNHDCNSSFSFAGSGRTMS